MATDFLIDDQGELRIENGDFVVGESSDQHIESILLANKGEVRDHPLIGIGIMNYLHAPNSQAVVSRLKRDIRLQLESDGATGISIAYNGNYQITANYAD